MIILLNLSGFTISSSESSIRYYYPTCYIVKLQRGKNESSYNVDVCVTKILIVSLWISGLSGRDLLPATLRKYTSNTLANTTKFLAIRFSLPLSNISLGNIPANRIVSPSEDRAHLLALKANKRRYNLHVRGHS